MMDEPRDPHEQPQNVVMPLMVAGSDPDLTARMMTRDDAAFAEGPATDAERMLVLGDKYPYDVPDGWADDPNHQPVAHEDWAHRAANGAIQSLQCRQGFDDVFHDIEEDTRVEIVSELAEVIRLANRRWMEHTR